MDYDIKNLAAFMNRCQNHYETGANNMANSTSNGFKRQLVVERGLLQRSAVDLSQGPLLETGNPLSMAIQGDAFFVVNTAEGARYTRNGQFTIDERRRLVDITGAPVLNEKGQEIIIEGNPTVGKDGSIYSENELITRLALVVPTDKTKVTCIGSDRFNFEPRFVNPGECTVNSEFLEGSNVDALKEMTGSLNFIRSFEIAQRVLKMSQTLGERCASDIANTGA